ncbi:MAG: type II CRISPR RNA-guided endonuclease Cas9 [Planctomycetia bacterium]
MAKQGELRPYVLGLDLGVNSIGWAALALDSAGQPTGLLTGGKAAREAPSMGVRIFQEAVDDLGRETEQTRNVARRTARLQRRQIARRAQRQRKAYRLLQQAGLLPAAKTDPAAGCTRVAQAIDAAIKDLDRRLADQLAAGRTPEQLRLLREHTPYALRAWALDEHLPPHAVGRALYHLAQRRGFKSNRRADRGRKAGDDEVGLVKGEIRHLEAEMGTAGARTLGEFLASIEPGTRRLRARRTSRAMYEHEFETLWTAQASHHPALQDALLRKRLHRALFFQRPLRGQSSLVGDCELEDGSRYVQGGIVRRTRRRRRAPLCLPLAQRFRLLQKVNDLRVMGTPHDRAGRQLTPDERTRLLALLDGEPKVTFAKVRSALGLPRSAGFNLQRGGETSLPGNATASAFRALMGDRWDSLDAQRQAALALEVWTIDQPDSLKKRAQQRLGPWEALGTPTTGAAASAELELLDALQVPDDYASLCAAAMRALLPRMEAGVPYATAVKEVYGSRRVEEAAERLAPYDEALGTLRNPVVARVLAEVRRVVNAVVALHGRPDRIHVELARDAKRSRKDRVAASKQMRKREAARDKAREAMAAVVPGRDVRGSDIERYLLWEECGHTCPYTGRAISHADLVSGAVQVEHIIPLSRSLDNGMWNKTLCFAQFNTQVKRNQTPWECLGGNPEAWQQACARAERLLPPEKAAVFQMQGPELEAWIAGFTARQLNDTRHASRLAMRYLATLYGGDLGTGVDAGGTKRIQASNGMVTALLRNALRLSQFLGADTKSRDDHRHHAIDALAVALTSPRTVQQVSRAAEQPWERRWYDAVPDPWAAFRTDVQQAVDGLLVSHQVRHPVQGRLHEATHYGVRKVPGEDKPVVHLRKPVHVLGRADLEAIVDPVVRQAVAEALARVEAGTAKAFDPQDPSTLPRMPRHDGVPGPVIRRVRLAVSRNPEAVGKEHRQRHVLPGSNHHVEIYEVLAPKGKGSRYRAKVVSLLEARQRVARGEPVECREHGPGTRHVMALAVGDVMRGADASGTDRTWLVRTTSTSGKDGIDLRLTSIADAGDSKARKNTRLRSLADLLQRGFRRITIDAIGRERRSHAQPHS